MPTPPIASMSSPMPTPPIASISSLMLTPPIASMSSSMLTPRIVLMLVVASLWLAGCGFQLVGTGLADTFNGYQIRAPANSKISERLEWQLEDLGMLQGGEQSIDFHILEESFTAGRSLATAAATVAEIQLNLSLEARITLPGEQPFRVQYSLHDFYPINYRDPHGNRALRSSLEDYLAGEAATLLIESVSNPTPN